MKRFTIAGSTVPRYRWRRGQGSQGEADRDDVAARGGVATIAVHLSTRANGYNVYVGGEWAGTVVHDGATTGEDVRAAAKRIVEGLALARLLGWRPPQGSP